MSLDAAAISALFAQVQSHAASLGLFEEVNTHEPKNAPGNGLWCSIWVQHIVPLAGASGLAATSGRVLFQARIGSSMLQEPQDGIDPNILTSVAILMAEYSGNFTLGGQVRNVDLLGQFGVSLSSQAGYLPIGQNMFRVMDVMVPLIINDIFNQAG